MNSSHPNDDKKSPEPPVPPPSNGQYPMAQPMSNPPPSQGQPVAYGKSEHDPSPSDPNSSYGKGEAGPAYAYPQQPYDQYGKGGQPPYPPQQSGQYVVGVPPQQVMVPAWSTGLFECFDDIPTFFITFFAPCITFGQIAEMVDRGRATCTLYALIYSVVMYFTGCGCLMSAYYRMKMAHQYKLPDDPLINILVHLICEPCALCQEHRELQAHGFNMQLGVGWKEQSPEIQQTGGIMVPPTVPGGMTR